MAVSMLSTFGPFAGGAALLCGIAFAASGAVLWLLYWMSDAYPVGGGAVTAAVVAGVFLLALLFFLVVWSLAISQRRRLRRYAAGLQPVEDALREAYRDGRIDAAAHQQAKRSVSCIREGRFTGERLQVAGQFLARCAAALLGLAAVFAPLLTVWVLEFRHREGAFLDPTPLAAVLATVVFGGALLLAAAVPLLHQARLAQQEALLGIQKQEAQWTGAPSGLSAA